MGHLNSFLASGRGNLNKNFPKIQNYARGRGLGYLSFDLTGTLFVNEFVEPHLGVTVIID